jgi:heptosyltransferase II
MRPLPDVIRTPNHLGDLVMALPALAAAPQADLVIARWLVPLVELLQRDGAIIPLDRGTAGLVAAARRLRGRSRQRGVLLPPSLSSAILFRLGGVRHVRGAATDGRGVLLSERVSRDRLRGRHRTRLYLELVSGTPADAAPAPALPVPPAVRARWHDVLRAAAAGRPGIVSDDAAGGDGVRRPVVGVFPGSNAPSRRWDAARFAAVCRDLAGDGAAVLVLGASAEAVLTREVAGRAGLDLGGRTDLPVLAAALSECDILVTNDSGPMHLAAAVGTRTLVVSGPADTQETAPGGTGHRYLQRLDLPCVPCVKNECPRRGAGFILAEAERECLRLIEVPEVLRAARRMLASHPN